MDEQTIPAGYKQTEVGVIPEDWEVNSLSSICDVRDGTHESPKYKDNGIPLVTSKNIVDDILDLSNVSLISPEDAFEINKRSKVDKGDIIMSMIGTVGSAVLLNDEPDFCIKNVALFKPKRVSGEFLVQLIRSKSFQDYLEDSMDGGIQKFVSLGTLRNMEIVLPSEPEQTAIANALSDVDALISEQEKLIDKKQAIKTATMQQLLTGKTRLPPFAHHPDGTPKGTQQTELGEIPEDWRVSTIGKFAPLQRGFDLPSYQRKNGNFPVVYSNGIVNHHSDFQVQGEGVVTGRSGTIGKVHYINSSFWPHNTTLWVTSFENSVAKYVYYLFLAIGFERFSSGSGVPTLNRNDAHDFKIAVPPKPEQSAIAQILSDIDKEIQTLQTRLSKTQHIKQGMMQQLLTGKVRLIKPSKEVIHE